MIHLIRNQEKFCFADMFLVNQAETGRLSASQGSLGSVFVEIRLYLLMRSPVINGPTSDLTGA